MVEAIISGVVQGLTEFLPISSSGHLVLLHRYFGYQEPRLIFDIFLHVGTLFAVIVYFWRDIINLITKQKRLLLLIIIASIPTAVIGFLFKDLLKSLFVNVRVVGIMLFVTAGFLFIGEWAAGRKKDKTGLSWFKALVIGIVQGISIIPGISRSGSTISTGMFLGLEKKEAVRFSFLLSIPAILGALAFMLRNGAGMSVDTLSLLAATASAFVVGLAAIYILIKAVARARLKFFAIYCLLMGTLILLGTS
ncbi:MAG: undecaprenyl-diphosphate phosphatase [Candidatus Omnitrophica bacterium]|nr:undecaprenyl-diphosphate phosphatase [Candidatus Omnitrophota bacterium]